MRAVGSKLAEADYYRPVQAELTSLFRQRFGDQIKDFSLEITPRGALPERVKTKVTRGREIVYYFLKQAYPDLTGYIEVTGNYAESGFITVEFKDDPLKLSDVYQARMYAELLDARYAFLISTDPVAEELKRLSDTYPLLVLPAYRVLTLATVRHYYKTPDRLFIEFTEWFRENPFHRA